MTTPPLSTMGTLPVQPRPRGWFDRNWKWIVTLLLILAFFIVVGFVGAVVYGVEALIKGSAPYQFAVRRATESPAVVERVGTPIHIGWFVSGNVHFSGSEGSVNLSIPISGPKGRGHIGVVGKEHAKRWTFQTLEVDLNGEDEPIRLQEEVPAPTPEPAGNPT
jgi:hypothetical protein